MKSIYLKSVLAFIFVGVMAMIVCIPFYIVYLAQQPATPEQLTEILQEKFQTGLEQATKHFRRHLIISLNL